MTFSLISTVTVGAGGSSTIDFSSIPQTFTDLQVVLSGRTSTTTGNTWADVILRFNGSSSNSYTGIHLYGQGTSPASFVDGPNTNGFVYRTSSGVPTSNTFGSGIVYIPNYTGSTNKLISMDQVTENTSSSALQIFGIGILAETAPVTQIAFTTISGNFVQNSTASLYGILKGSGGATVS